MKKNVIIQIVLLITLLLYIFVKKEVDNNSINQKDYASCFSPHNDDPVSHWTASIEERKRLPRFFEIPAATFNELSFSENTDLQKMDFYTWSRSNSNSNNVRYSDFNQINKNNIESLEIAFVYNSENLSNDTIQANPIVIDRQVIFPVSGNTLVSIDGASGQLIWKSELESLTNIAKRGLVYWEDKVKGHNKIFVPTAEGLAALDKNSGKLLLNFGNSGVSGLGKSVVAPVIAKNIVAYATVSKLKCIKIIKWYSCSYIEPSIQGIDVVSGEILWETKIHKQVGQEFITCLKGYGIDYSQKGGNPWSGLAADEKRGIVFVTTGDAHNTQKTPFSNKHSNSLIAIDINNGDILWSFQEISHDLWDLDLASPPVLTSINTPSSKGKLVDVVLAISKLGNTILLDRVTGKPIYPWRLEKTPIPVKAEFPDTAAYFPNPLIPEKLLNQSITIDDLTNIGDENYKSALASFESLSTKFPYESPFDASDSREPKGVLVFGVNGGGLWPGPSVDPNTGIMYVATNNTGTILPSFKDFRDHEGFYANKPPWGKLTALDLNTGKIKWSVPLGDDKRLKKRGFKNIGTKNICGPLATSGGLVFCGGTTDKLFRAFDKQTGKLVWSRKMPAYGSAPPTTYEIDNKQYIIVPATGGTTGTLYRDMSIDASDDFNFDASDAFVVFSLNK